MTMRKLLYVVAVAWVLAFIWQTYAHADIFSAVVPKTIVVLWAKEATTKEFGWGPDETFETMRECSDKKKKLENTPNGNMDAHGFPRPLKCVRYRRI